MSEKPEARRWTVAGVASGLVLLLAGGVCGSILGGLYVKLFVPKTGMGWDQIADALGGLMLGGLLGLGAGGILIALLDVRRRLLGAAALTVIAAAVGAGLVWTRPDKRQSEPVVVEKPFKPWFKASIRVGHSEAILRGVEPGSEPVPFTEASVWSVVPVLEHEGWGPDFRRCEAEPAREDLQLLAPLVSTAADEATGGICRTPREDDLGVVVNITLEGERSGGTVEADCLAERPAMVALAKAIGELADRLCLGPE